MPNNRNKNRNRRNKNRNRNNNQNKNENQNKSNVQKVQDENLHEASQTGIDTDTISSAAAFDIVVPKSEPAQCFSNNDADLMSQSETEANAIENSSSRDAINKTNQECRTNEIITVTDTYTDDRTISDATNVPSNDTVLHGTSSHVERQTCDAGLITEMKEDIRREENILDNDNEVLVNLQSACVSIFTDMGAKDSKTESDTQSDTADNEHYPDEGASNAKNIKKKTITRKTSPLRKVIVHQVVPKEARLKRNNSRDADEPQQTQQQMTRKKKSANRGTESQEENVRVIIHRVVLEEPNKTDNDTWKTATTGNFSDTTVDSSNNDYNEDTSDAAIKKLRLLCTETLASMPYGEQVLEELATVAQNIGEVRATKSVQSNEAGTTMPYPIPKLPHINDLQLSIDDQAHRQPTGSVHTIAIKQLSSSQINENKQRSPSPPLVPDPPSKYDEPWLGLPTGSNPNLFVCLSPSQRSYINDQPQHTSDNSPDQLLDAHQKFIGRRGYHEYSSEQVKAMNAEKLEEQQILKTAAIMKKLRKSLTPPPPIPPPPVPSKSLETAAKAHSHTKRASDNDVSFRNANEQQITAIPATTTKTVAAAECQFTDGEEENGHRLLAIIHDTNEYKQNYTPPKTSSFENNPRKATQKQLEQSPQPLSRSAAIQTWIDQPKLVEIPKEHIIKIIKSGEVIASPEKENMQSVESEIGKMFPTMGSTNIFDTSQKRFSNIETSSNTPYGSQILNTQPKRYSNIETHSYESKKRVENGNIVFDSTNSKHECQSDGDKLSSSTITHQRNVEAPQPYPPNESEIKKFIAKNENKESKIKVNQASSNAEEIMSALKLNTNDSIATTTTAAAEAATATETRTTTSTHSEQQHLNDNTNAKLSETTEETRRREFFKNRQQNEENKDINSAYEEFRQRAKTAAEATVSAPPPATAPATFSGDKLSKSSFHFDHEKLFKDFDDLSQQLHKELETGKQQREQREKSASLYDLSRVQMQFGDQFSNLKKERHEHMKELENEIERSMRSRHLKSLARHEAVLNGQQKPQQNQQQQPRTFEIPIKIENGSTDTYKSSDRTDNSRYNNLNESAYKVTTPVTPYNYEYDENAHYRRAESMFNLSENTSSQSHRPRTSSSSKPSYVGNPDDWSRYAKDLGSSENIVKPFAREVEICYQRQRPRTIRAPRLSASTNDLSLNSHTYDSYNAYNVRRTHAPMLNQAPQHSRPQYLSCHSMIERDPNPTYISTTSRRGASPAPGLVSAGAPPPPPPVSPMHYASHETYDRELNKRRASLPREIHEQQLKYISSKEEDLKNEIERLQNDRRRLMEDLNHSQIPAQQPPMTHMRSMRDVYRPTSKLPTLSEDEVFRQQMAEEWLNKVAEREERRLHKIIKISKSNEHEAHQIPIHHTTSIKQDIGEEFLNRVKERRSKLAMPADSDWESGAESMPVLQEGHVSETDEVPKIKIIEGKSEADLRQLPRHLREFAKFSNHQCENIEGGQREVHQEEKSRHEANNNCINSAMKKSSVVKTVKISRPSENQHQQPQLSVVNQNVFSANSAATSGQSGQVYKVKHEYMSEPETESDRPKKMAQLSRRQIEGIGPVTNDGMPIVLRSEVKEPHQHEWYKRLYQTIHKQKTGARPQYKSTGYQSEPEPHYDSEYSTVKYRTLDRRRLQSVSSAANVRSGANSLQDERYYDSMPNTIKPGQNSYKNQPGRIENYITGHSSVSDKEKKEWWDEVMDIFNGHLEPSKLSPHYTEGNLSRALAKESGYTSDSNLVFRKKEVSQSSPLSPVEQKQAYKIVQAGGEPPLFGFRKLAPEKHKDYAPPIPPQPPTKNGNCSESPSRYVESDVNIHFKTPIRHEYKTPISEEELAYRQAGQMQKLYQEERRRKYLQELQDMNSRRHTDNFTPSQKSPIPLNRYDDFQSGLAPKSPITRLVARALYNFQGQNARELSFRKGEIIYIRRLIDKNWYEGEHNAMIGLLPVSYIEIINKDGPRQQPKKPSEGQARAKYNFQAQSGVELSLNKGELVTLTRRVDDNWFEGKIANRKGIFPVSYVEVLTDIGAEDIAAKTVITEHSTTNLRPSLDTLRTNINNEFNIITQNGNQPPNGILKETKNLHKTDILHVDTSSVPLTYRALYKYRPQNSDELELLEGDVVHVLEKCDDGWFVGTSQRTGCFGTFPGNYVERA